MAKSYSIWERGCGFLLMLRSWAGWSPPTRESGWSTTRTRYGSPDIAFFSTEKIPPGVRVTGYSETVPDLVVEVHSPSDSMREVHDKARMWLSYGVRLVWVVHPDTRTVDVHHQEQSVSTLNEEDALDGMDVLTGFSCAIGDLFPA